MFVAVASPKAAAHGLGNISLLLRGMQFCNISSLHFNFSLSLPLLVVKVITAQDWVAMYLGTVSCLLWSCHASFSPKADDFKS